MGHVRSTSHPAQYLGTELVEHPTCAVAHDTSGGAAAGQDQKQDKAGTRNSERAGERQTVTGLKRKCVRFSHSFECRADGSNSHMRA